MVKNTVKHSFTLCLFILRHAKCKKALCVYSWLLNDAFDNRKLVCAIMYYIIALHLLTRFFSCRLFIMGRGISGFGMG